MEKQRSEKPEEGKQPGPSNPKRNEFGHKSTCPQVANDPRTRDEYRNIGEDWFDRHNKR
uniref:Uncharacterized protein n=1 Tax=Tetranychus urticae TaxID=32264 RepID=T1JX16_TETUR